MRKGVLESEEETASLRDLPELAEIQGAVGPSKEDLCLGQRTCPTLEGHRQQAERQVQGDVSGNHRVYWDEGVLYSEARDPKPGASRRLVVPQMYRPFLLSRTHGIPLTGHLGQTTTWD